LRSQRNKIAMLIKQDKNELQFTYFLL